MQSLTLKRVQNFNINQPYVLSTNGNEVGSIAPDNPTTIVVETHVLKVFSATFMETVKEDIFVLNDDDELLSISEYKRSETFKIFFDESRQILYSTAPSAISKNFFKILEEMEPTLVKLSNFIFDFNSIQTQLNSTRGIAFNTEEQGVQKKRFSGNNVEANQEAGNALNEDTATFLIGKMDVLQKERTIGFTRSGALLMYSSLKDIANENPFLNAANAIISIIN